MLNSRQPSADELPSTGQLLRSTVIAAAAAVVILFTVVLPAEYGVDPTGIGRLIGLTPMGETKMQLAREAADAAAGAVKSTGSAPPAAAPPAVATIAPRAPTMKTDEVAVTLKPGQAAEIKVEMHKGARITYRWIANGGRVNFDTHGDPPNRPRGFYHGYGKGLGAEGDHGVLEAAFDGLHGWFWRNRTTQDVTVTLRIEGDDLTVKRVL